jgi:hypothetical protein
VDDLDAVGHGAGEVEATRTIAPQRVGFNFKVRPRAEPVEAAKIGKQQAKKNTLAVELAVQRRRVQQGSQRGEAPKLTRLDL